MPEADVCFPYTLQIILPSCKLKITMTICKIKCSSTYLSNKLDNNLQNVSYKGKFNISSKHQNVAQIDRSGACNFASFS